MPATATRTKIATDTTCMHGTWHNGHVAAFARMYTSVQSGGTFRPALHAK